MFDKMKKKVAEKFAWRSPLIDIGMCGRHLVIRWLRNRELHVEKWVTLKIDWTFWSLKGSSGVICKKRHRWICSGWCGQIPPARQSIHCAIRSSDLASSSGNVGVSTKDHPHLEREERSVTVGRRGVTKRRGGSSCASVSLYPAPLPVRLP